MIARLTIVRYPEWMGWAGFLSMALFRFPLWLQNKSIFWKLMGCGRNGSFDKTPDWRQWAILEIWDDHMHAHKHPHSIERYWQFFGCEKWTLLLKPLEGHGLWDGKEAFGTLPKQTDYNGTIAILTRATIRISRLSHFWKQVDRVAEKMSTSPGFITSVGIGEVPWIKQATFSIWESKEAMKNFAYRMQEHADVVRKTRQENWYSEEMFVRFQIIENEGSLRGQNPLKRNP
jgi:heme-degrading monooxygenase HmoA